MKKIVFAGIALPLYFELMLNIIIYILNFDLFHETISKFGNVLLYIISSFAGVLYFILLPKKSVIEFTGGLCVSFSVSAIVFFIYTLLGIDRIIFQNITGFEELGLGYGFVLVITFKAYFVSCIVGAIVAFIITLVKQHKLKHTAIKM